MRLQLSVFLAGMLLLAARLPAFEAVGTLERVDAGQGVVQVRANGQAHTVRAAVNVEVLGADGQPLADGLHAAALKTGTVVSVSLDPGQGGPVLRVLRIGGRTSGPAAGREAGRTSVGFKPLTEMTAEDRYQGEDGGLYGAGRNDPPAAHFAAARRETERIAPLDANGRPAANGTIGLVAISMSNATQEYALFKQLADADPRKSPRVAIVDCAQGGQAMAQWVDPAGRPWAEAERRLAAARVSTNQVQVIWVKLANVAPSGDLAAHGRKLQRDTLAVLHDARARFPNLRIAYLGSRIYGGYATTRLNPEPYAYEGAFAVRWLIADQIRGDPELAFQGAAQAPLLLWGPYFWADGTTPRKSDGLVWERSDLREDGTHPSESGRRKAAGMLMAFFEGDPLASTWFLRR